MGVSGVVSLLVAAAAMASSATAQMLPLLSGLNPPGPYNINSTDAKTVTGLSPVTASISVPADPSLTSQTANQVIFGLFNAYRQNFPTNQSGYFFENLFEIRPAEIGLGGNLTRWNIGNNPALWGQGVSQSLVTFNPCGINLPHVHPRGLEFIHVLRGTLVLSLFEENNGRLVTNNLVAGNSFFIPQGFLHTEHNLACAPAAFMNTFNHVDPGTATTSEAFFNLPIEAIQTALGNIDISIVNQVSAAVKATVNLAQGPPSCLTRCGCNSAGVCSSVTTQ
jgi:oxalate decarboxylase/phosphoglucose isomerase-like protein (cupin superfamily)